MISKIRYIFNQPHKREILKGSFETITIKVMGMLIGYAFILILSRNFGAKAVGIYQISLQFIVIASTISLLGFNQAIIRFSSELISKNHISELKKIIKKFSFISFLLSIAIATTIYFFSKELTGLLLKDQDLIIVFKLLSIALPFYTLNLLYVELMRGLKKIKASEMLRIFSTSLFNLIIFLSIIRFFEFNYLLPVISYETAIFITFVLSFYYASRFLNKNANNNVEDETKENRKYISTSFTLYQSILLMMLSNQILIFILAYYTKPEEVGIYNTALQIASLSSFVFGAVITITAPKFSELYRHSKNEFSKMVRFSSKLIFWSTGSIAIVTILLSHWLMGLFGKEFIVGASILSILSLGNFINAFTGPSGILLDMIGKQIIRRNILFINTVIIFTLSLILIPRFGGIGLAYTNLISTIISNFVGVVYIKKNLGINLIYLPSIIKLKG